MNFIKLKNELPTGNQTFAALRQHGKVYVDKTSYVYAIATSDQPQILTRPRRFGKSTLLSTIEELFLHGVEPYNGHDSYFKGLAIESLWHDDGDYLVLHLDFNNINSKCKSRTVAQFEQKLMQHVTTFCRKQKIDLSNELAPEPFLSEPLSFSDIFDALVQQIPDYSLVLLIDEYDAPLIAHANDQAELQECQQLMRGLFATIKSFLYKFRFVFFTGITRFQDLNLGTNANNFTDVSYDAIFAACCGYTRAELKQYFAEHLRYAAAIRNDCTSEAVSAAHIEALLDEMSDWYDGYSFDGSQQNKVFSTWSVLRFFGDVQARLQPYWSTEKGFGLPQVIQFALERINVPKMLYDLRTGELVVDYDQFMESSLVNPEANPYSLLFQTGYLTFSRSFYNGDKLHLKSPNQELNIAFGNLLCQRVFKIHARYSPEYTIETIPILASLDPDKIRAHFNHLFEDYPYAHYPVKDEGIVQGYVYTHLRALGLRPRVEVMTTSGRADCVFDLPELKLTFVFEFKFEESSDAKKLDAKLAEAVKQIKDHKYGLTASSQPNVARFALVFCGEHGQRNFARVTLVDLVDLSQMI